MYTNPSGALAAGAGSGVLAATGAGSIFWIVLAGFALLAAGLAIMRIIPRKEK